jgi:hypothetical protein
MNNMIREPLVKMRNIHRDEFIKIKFHSMSNGLYIYWFSNNQFMSNLDFLRSTEAILDSIVELQPSKILINAVNFNFPIRAKEATLIIRFVISRSSKNQCRIINSEYLLGQITITQILRRFSTDQTNGVLCNSPVKALRWLLM